MNPIETIYINNVATAVEVINGVFKFPYNIGQELTAIRFVGTNANNTITSINLKKADLFASVAHLDYCFMNCTALTEIDFGKKSFGSLQHAVDAFKGCTELTTIKIDASSEWAPDVDLLDCPLTYTSMLAFANALKTYNSGTHTIKFNVLQLMILTPAEYNNLVNKVHEKHWDLNGYDLQKYSKAELDDMIYEQGYVPISTAKEFIEAYKETTQTMGSMSLWQDSYVTGPDKNYVLVRNIDCSELDSAYFILHLDRLTTTIWSGITDGALLSISNFYNWEKGKGLFVQNNGTIKNIVFKNCSIAHVGSTARVAVVGDNYGTLDSIAYIGNVSSGIGQGIAGICGQNFAGEIKHCYSNVVISGYAHVGGIVGRQQSTGTAQCSDCISKCHIILGVQNAGGIAGQSYERTTIENCCAIAELTGANSLSGLVNFSRATVTDSYYGTDLYPTSTAGIGKTLAQLVADSIGSGIYTNWSTDIWDKDIIGLPRLKIFAGLIDDTDYTFLQSFSSVQAIVEVLPILQIPNALKLNDALWQSLTSAEQNTLTATATAKNWTIVH